MRRISGDRTAYLLYFRQPPGLLSSRHEGPYVTIDDVVDDRYKRHPSVQHIPGQPVCDQVKLLGTTAMALMKVCSNLRTEFKS
jgi:hypothetical protein